MFKNDWVICDLTGIILNDSKTLYPGYVEIRAGKLYRYESDDPLNEIKIYKPWVMGNRVKYKKVALTRVCKTKRLQGKHFMSERAMEEYLKKEN